MPARASARLPMDAVQLALQHPDGGAGASQCQLRLEVLLDLLIGLGVQFLEPPLQLACACGAGRGWMAVCRHQRRGSHGEAGKQGTGDQASKPSAEGKPSSWHQDKTSCLRGGGEQPPASRPVGTRLVGAAVVRRSHCDGGIRGAPNIYDSLSETQLGPHRCPSALVRTAASGDQLGRPPPELRDASWLPGGRPS